MGKVDRRGRERSEAQEEAARRNFSKAGRPYTKKADGAGAPAKAKPAAKKTVRARTEPAAEAAPRREKPGAEKPAPRKRREGFLGGLMDGLSG